MAESFGPAVKVYRDPTIPGAYVYNLTPDPNDPTKAAGYSRYPGGATGFFMNSVPFDEFVEADVSGGSGSTTPAPVPESQTDTGGRQTAADIANNNTSASATQAPPLANEPIIPGVGLTLSQLFDQADTGTDAPTQRLNQTQAVPPSGVSNSLPGPGTVSPPRPTQSSGQGAASDDQTRSGSALGTSSVTETRRAIEAIFSGQNAKIQPTPNILDQYSSYSYNISLYIMSPEDYQRLLRSKQRRIPNNQLLMASGGAPSAGAVNLSSTGNTSSTADDLLTSLQRNQYFPLDYYLDDIMLQSLCPGKGTQGAHNVFEMQFKIYEPNGITLLDNLFAATQEYVASNADSSKPQNYAAQNYLMVVRFYGYDQDGNLVKPRNNDGTGQTDSNAIVEKFIPFQFTEVKFRVMGKVTEYSCSAVCPQHVIGAGQARGVIPYNIELTSTTLENLLTGNLTFSGGITPQSQTEGRQPSANGDGTRTNNSGSPAGQNTAPANIGSAPTPTMVSGLADALNRFQQEKVQDGTFTYPDEYEIIIVENVLKQARVVPPGSTNLRQTPLTNPRSAADSADGTRQSVNTGGRNLSALAGMSVVQFIDQVIRTSSYIYDQQIAVIDPVTGDNIPQGIPGETMAWFRIGMQAEPKLDQYDPKRNDYAYKITYQINVYKINNLKSDYFPQSKFMGTHKKYDYWFTGQNTSVLDFEQDFNYLYYMVVNKNPPQRTGTSNWREYEKRAFQPRSNQSDQGQEGAVNEPSANAADYLYSPADQSRAKLEIVGDPAWIQQGEIWHGVSGLDLQYGPFLTDGTINYESQEVLFEIAFNKPVDYELNTGIMDVGRTNYNANRRQGKAGDASQSYVYKATEVKSYFSKGAFKQDLNGVMVIYPTEYESQTIAQRSTNQGALDEARQSGTAEVQNSVQTGNSAVRAYTNVGNDAEVTTTTNNNNPNGIVSAPVQTVNPAQNSPVTSNGDTVGIQNSSADSVSGGVFERSFTTTVQLTAGGVQTVTSIEQVQTLLRNGDITFAEANNAVNRLTSLNNNQQPQVTTDPAQQINRDF